nr:translin-1 [Quercus suber]
MSHVRGALDIRAGMRAFVGVRGIWRYGVWTGTGTGGGQRHITILCSAAVFACLLSLEAVSRSISTPHMPGNCAFSRLNKLHDGRKYSPLQVGVSCKCHEPGSHRRLSAAEPSTSIQSEIATIQTLAALASQHPYYKFSYAWTRQMQDVTLSILLNAWLERSSTGRTGSDLLLTIEEVGQTMSVPVNLKTSDAFHLTIEEYLLALISLLDELARLARNSVTLGDHARPLQIAQFIKDVHAGFQLLNLRNDVLRKRSDGIKYRVKEVEDVVYDLSLRGLLPKA